MSEFKIGDRVKRIGRTNGLTPLGFIGVIEDFNNKDTFDEELIFSQGVRGYTYNNDNEPNWTLYTDELEKADAINAAVELLISAGYEIVPPKKLSGEIVIYSAYDNIYTVSADVWETAQSDGINNGHRKILARIPWEEGQGV
jgi:hypothetical protein